jgi:hypothetical protein
MGGEVSFVSDTLLSRKCSSHGVWMVMGKIGVLRGCEMSIIYMYILSSLIFHLFFITSAAQSRQDQINPHLP